MADKYMRLHTAFTFSRNENVRVLEAVVSQMQLNLIGTQLFVRSHLTSWLFPAVRTCPRICGENIIQNRLQRHLAGGGGTCLHHVFYGFTLGL